MGSQRSKEDEVQKISTSLFITNFPDSLSAKDLLIRVRNMGTLWMRLSQPKDQKLVKGLVLCVLSRFQRTPLNKDSTQVKNKYGENKNNTRDHNKDNEAKGFANSYAHVVKGGSQPVNVEVESTPALVLDDECLNPQDLSNALMGRVKEFPSLSNLKMVLANEGFDNIKIKYLGEFWVLLKFAPEESKKLFHENIFWIRAKEVPGWVPDLMEDNEEEYDSDCDSKDGDLKGEDVGLKSCSILGEDSDVEEVSETKFEEGHHKSNMEGAFVGQMDMHYEDPFKIYDLLNKKQEDINKGPSLDNSLKYPPDFTPNDGTKEKGKKNGESEKESGECSHTGSKKGSKEDVAESICSAIALDRYLSDHRPIFLRESQFDYCPIPFCFFHYWVEMDGFDKLVEDAWKGAPVEESNAVELADLDKVIDKGEGNAQVVNKRMGVVKSLQYLEKLQSLEAAQKAKIKWAIEGDENSKYYHVHFKSRFAKPDEHRIHLNMLFSNTLSSDQRAEMQIDVSKEEIKKAVWDWGIDKSPGPDGFTFGFYRRFWKVIENDVVGVVTYFFHHGIFPKGSNSSFIALILKISDANMVKDYRPISLIGSLYKIIAKILANRLVNVLGDNVNKVQSAFVTDRQILDGPFILNELFQWCKSKKKQSLVFKVDFEKAYDSVRWDFLDDILKKFGFGDRWCGWIQSCLKSSRGSIIVNGSPTEEFQFYKGLKQGDPLSLFLCILVMESLHISFQRVVDTGMFKGIALGPALQLSHMFYVDDAVFVGQWSDANIDTIVNMLDCFHRASGMRINMNKSKLIGISMEEDKVAITASKIGCLILKTPFSYLGSKVGGLMSRIQSWNEVVDRVIARLSKWKMKTLSIGGRLTLLKSVLGSIPIYHMSIFKVLMRVLHRLESIRCHFFNGNDPQGNKPSWVKWKNVLASKEKGGLGVSSLYALNRGLMLKRVWRFITQSTSLWAGVIKAIHGDDEKMRKNAKFAYPYIWLDIVHEMDLLKKQGIDVANCIKIKLGNGAKTRECFLCHVVAYLGFSQ
ncbi:RNA-directed DNA polymerase, eukaryota, reverse transcriptase zinc-binding domain protein [Tanacetum coccineum]